MILILGKKEDDILYLKESFVNVEEVVFPSSRKGYKVKSGSKTLLFAASKESNYLSVSLVMEANALEKLEQIITVGAAAGIASELSLGDLVLVNDSYLHGVNFLSEHKPYGQLADYGPALSSDNNLLARMESILSEQGVTCHVGELLSGEKRIFDKQEFDSILERRFLGKDHLLAYDTFSCGAALGAKMLDIPYLSMKVIAFLPDGGDSRTHYKQNALKGSESIAKAILKFLK